MDGLDLFGVEDATGPREAPERGFSLSPGLAQ